MGLRLIVFPTPVGMNRNPVIGNKEGSCVPHTRGDEPALQLI